MVIVVRVVVGGRRGEGRGGLGHFRSGEILMTCLGVCSSWMDAFLVLPPTWWVVLVGRMAINEATGFTDRKKAKDMQAMYARLRGESRPPPTSGLGADADGDVYDFYVLGANHGVSLHGLLSSGADIDIEGLYASEDEDDDDVDSDSVRTVSSGSAMSSMCTQQS